MPRSLALLLLLAALVLPATPAHAQRVAAGQFTVVCDYSHTLPDDPIVVPGRPGAAHAHDFAGARSTDAFSTDHSLLHSDTSCSRTEDHSAYWVPALYHHGQFYRARHFRAYYRGAGFAAGEVHPFPEGLRLIAGDAKTTDAGPYQPLTVVSWACTRPGSGPDGQEVNEVHVPADCGGQSLRMRIVFPRCWNGRDLDAPDHKSHMAYASRGRCPATHPVVVPQLTLSLRYRVPDTTGISLSSGGTHSQHADFWSAWEPGAQASLVERCINSGVRCAEQAPPAQTPTAPAPQAAPAPEAAPAPPPAVASTAPAPRRPAPGGAGRGAAQRAAAERAAIARRTALRRAAERCAGAMQDVASRSAARRAAARRGLANCTTAERRAAKRLAAERAAARCAAARRAARGGSAARRAAARRTLARCAAARRTAARRATARRAARRAARAAHHHGH